MLQHHLAGIHKAQRCRHPRKPPWVSIHHLQSWHARVPVLALWRLQSTPNRAAHEEGSHLALKTTAVLTLPGVFATRGRRAWGNAPDHVTRRPDLCKQNTATHHANDRPDTRLSHRGDRSRTTVEQFLRGMNNAGHEQRSGYAPQ